MIGVNNWLTVDVENVTFAACMDAMQNLAYLLPFADTLMCVANEVLPALKKAQQTIC